MSKIQNIQTQRHKHDATDTLKSHVFEYKLLFRNKNDNTKNKVIFISM